MIIKDVFSFSVIRSKYKRFLFNKIKAMPGVKCLKCGRVMDRTEIGAYIVTDVTSRFISVQRDSHRSACSYSVVDKGLAGAANGLALTCPKCSNAKRFAPN